MGIFTSGIVSDLMGGIFGIFDDLHTSTEEKAEIRLKLMQIGMSADLAQIEVNKREAASGFIFVSGWRPFIGWVCGSAFAYNYILSPFIMGGVYYYAQLTGKVVDLSGLPQLDLATMIPVLMGMLGLGGLRTYEKGAGVARTSMAVESPTVKLPPLEPTTGLTD